MIGDPCRSLRAEVRTILVIEDEILIRFEIAEVLREAGMRVIEARNADEAMEHLGAGRSVDFVFTDIEMPGTMNGLEFCAAIQRRFPRTQVPGDFQPNISRGGCLQRVVYSQALRSC